MRNNTVTHRKLIVSLLVLAILILSLFMVQQRSSARQLDISDEIAHLMSIESYANLEIPSYDTHYSAAIMQLENCNPIEIYNVPVKCGAKNASVTSYFLQGIDYVAVDTPLTYLAYLPFINSNLSPAEVLSHARQGGALWVVLTAIAILFFCFRKKYSIIQSGVFASICLLSPVFTWSAGTVSDDASVIFVSILAIVAFEEIEKNNTRYRYVYAGILGIVLALFRATLILIPMFMILNTLLSTFQDSKTHRIQSFVKAASISLTTFLLTLMTSTAWAYWQKVRAPHAASIINSMSAPYNKSGFLWNLIWGNTGFFHIFGNYNNLPRGLTQIHGTVLTFISSVLIFVSLLVFPLFLKDKQEKANVSSQSIALFLAVFSYCFFITSSSLIYFGYSQSTGTRYYLPLIPFIALILIQSVSNKRLLALVGMTFPCFAAIAQVLH